ncbi:PAS domain-containing protein [Pseudaminobacter arsenicus]|uniref:PAS domain-containing protein n=1 Tax=Borborobacter arsenicus TaxID=1851146 RepID=A0A432V935_9HYPH|nr:PAS domain-containing protein [Pseudaminobacter arsenicus]RUM98655.1 PAS domain-containing protein [Pseudaminobacter arsenicus]
MKHNGSIELFHYWNRLRSGRRAPKRTEIEPVDIKALLADTFILERDTRGEAVFRLAGTRLCATFGRELKGFSFPSLWREKDRRLVARLVFGVFQSKSVIVIGFDGRSQNGRSLEFELLMLPLDGGIENPRAMGVISPAEKPFWLGTDPINDALIDSVRVIDPDREPMFLKNRPSVTVPPLVPSERALAQPVGNLDGARRIRHLVVLPGGREK